MEVSEIQFNRTMFSGFDVPLAEVNIFSKKRRNVLLRNGAVIVSVKASTVRGLEIY